MLTEIFQESKPCSGGWPYLCQKKFSVSGFPTLTVTLSYYHGRDARPYPGVGLLENGNRPTKNSLYSEINLQRRLFPDPLEDKEIPLESEIASALLKELTKWDLL